MKKLILATMISVASCNASADANSPMLARSAAETVGMKLSYSDDYQTQYSSGNAKTIISDADICFTAYDEPSNKAKIQAIKAFKLYAGVLTPKSFTELSTNSQRFNVSGLSVIGGAVFFENDMYVWAHHTSKYQQTRMCVTGYDPRKGYTKGSESIPLVKL